LLELDISVKNSHQNNHLDEADTKSGFLQASTSVKEFLKKNLKHLPLIAIIIGSIIVRIFAAYTAEGFVHPDEVFQTIEMIHYRIFGRYGTGQTIPWEYNQAYEYSPARSWFFVLILAVVYRFVMLLGVTDPLDLILSARIFLSLFSIMTVVTSYYFGKEAFNKPVGLITAFLVGFWWFFPFWASRTMSDSMSSDLLFLSIFLIYRCIKKIKQPKKKFTLSLIAGILVGLAFMIRFPSALMGFPLAFFVIGYAIRDIVKEQKSADAKKFTIKDFLTTFSPLWGFVIGAFSLVLVQGVLDLITWPGEGFLASPINFFVYNIIEGKSADHGTAHWTHYFTGFFTDFGFQFLPIFLLFFFVELFSEKKIETKGILLAITFFWIILFSFIAHKEFRFIMVILPICLMLVASGIYRFVKMFQNRKLRYIAFAIIISTISASSILVATVTKANFWKNNSGVCNAMYYVGQQEDAETLIVFENIWYTGGYSYLHRNITCFFSEINLLYHSTYNSTFYRLLFAQNGTYIIVLSGDYLVMLPIVLEFNMTFVGAFESDWTAYVYKQIF